jgi:hypothetical protein
MIVLEYLLQEFRVKWLRLKIYEEHEIAVGYYLPRKSGKTRSRKQKITAAVFAPGVSMLGEEMVGMLPATVRKFKKEDRKIAHWYFRELCRAYKNGILEPLAEHRNPFGKRE